MRTSWKRCALRVARDSVNLLLSVLEQVIFPLRKSEQPKYRVVFIIGAPRSGTTLLYQALVSRFRFGYFDNISGRLYLAPGLGLYLSRLARLRRTFTSSFHSSHGSAKGLFEPNEAAHFWKRWFPDEAHYISWEKVKTMDLTYMTTVVRTLSRIAGAPFLFKRVYNSVRLSALSSALPEALFVVCHRDTLEIARSMLNSRKMSNTDLNAWWGVKPKRYDNFEDRPWSEQIAAQIYDIYSQIAEDARRIGSNRFYHIHYSELCENPRVVIEQVGRFVESHGFSLEEQGTLPERFRKSSGGKSTEDEDHLLISALADLAEKWSFPFARQTGSYHSRTSGSSFILKP